MRNLHHIRRESSMEYLFAYILGLLIEHYGSDAVEVFDRNKICVSDEDSNVGYQIEITVTT